MDGADVFGDCGIRRVFDKVGPDNCALAFAKPLPVLIPKRNALVTDQHEGGRVVDLSEIDTEPVPAIQGCIAVVTKPWRSGQNTSNIQKFIA
jgi:hypothetical protein